MSLKAAALLDEAWDLYYHKVASHDAPGVANQSPSWLPPRTPYDWAAGLCRSLLPLTYNYSEAHHPGVTDEIWQLMVSCGEVIDIKYVNDILNREG